MEGFSNRRLVKQMRNLQVPAIRGKYQHQNLNFEPQIKQDLPIGTNLVNGRRKLRFFSQKKKEKPASLCQSVEKILVKFRSSKFAGSDLLQVQPSWHNLVHNLAFFIHLVRLFQRCLLSSWATKHPLNKRPSMRGTLAVHMPPAQMCSG